MRRLVEIVMQGHHNAQEAKRKLQQMKAKIGTNLITGSVAICVSLIIVQQVEQEKKILMARVFEEVTACFEAEYHRVCRQRKKCAAR